MLLAVLSPCQDVPVCHFYGQDLRSKSSTITTYLTLGGLPKMIEILLEEADRILSCIRRNVSYIELGGFQGGSPTTQGRRVWVDVFPQCKDITISTRHRKYHVNKPILKYAN